MTILSPQKTVPERAQNTIRIANCSGFYGDKLSAAREMVEGGPIDVLTGDYLAELTMAILHRKRQQDSSTGYIGTFLKQLQDVIEPCLERAIKVVTYGWKTLFDRAKNNTA